MLLMRRMFWWKIKMIVNRFYRPVLLDSSLHLAQLLVLLKHCDKNLLDNVCQDIIAGVDTGKEVRISFPSDLLCPGME